MLGPGTLIDGRYEMLAAIGSGGMGHVYRARRTRLGDEVAIKVMQAPHDAPPETRERFLREARACAQLRHPNIVSILDFGVDATNQPYLVMELLSGPSLREEIELEAPMSVARVAAVLGAVAGALQLAHDRGITHRDLKPANIVAHRYESGDRVYKVIDFGLAAIKAASDETRLTDPDLFVGTLAYAAPEQIRGEAVSPATDIYTLGVIAYEMLTGTRPFNSDNRVTLINEMLTVRPVNPAKRRSGLSEAIDTAIMRSLSKDPEERWPSATEFARALERAAGEGAGAGPAADGAGLLGKYELGALIGRGRLGSLIYHGTHRAMGVPVAIRVLRRDEQPHWDAVRARFLLEARTQQVAHPGLLQVRDYGQDDKGVYLVTDFIEGDSLRQLLAAAGRLAWPRAARLLDGMLDATTALHRRGGLLVGVNPDMIRLTAEGDGERAVMSAAGIQSVQDVLATMREQELRGQEASEQELPYVPPEVLMGRPPDGRSDQFTLGVLAYQMTTGQVPFRAPTLPELIGRMLQARPASPDSLAVDVPPSAAAAILRALAPDPAARHADVSALRTALSEAQPA
ncbi:MAG: serine/threonine-protein kinase [Vicinamibacterales bacterium]